MGKEISMLIGVGLGHELWAEAVDTTRYFINRSPTSALIDKNPHETWTGKKPSLKHLIVLGCDSYVHIPKEKRIKLENKYEKSISIGFKVGIKGYKLWNPVTKNIIF
jgi:hypothetical protein